MTIPSASALYTPLLKFLSDQNHHSIEEAKDSLAKTFQLSDSERKKTYAGRERRIFDTTVIQTVSRLRNEGLLENKEKGVFKITKAGLSRLKQNPEG